MKAEKKRLVYCTQCSHQVTYGNVVLGGVDIEKVCYKNKSFSYDAKECKWFRPIYKLPTTKRRV